MDRNFPIENVEVILGNSNKNFSGVTSTMLQTFPIQLKHMNVMVMGRSHMENTQHVIGFFQAAKVCFKPLPNNKKRIFHARRNNEMIQALFLKYFLFAKIKILFTSTAQRHHSKFTRKLMGKMDAVISTCTNAAKYLRTPPKQIVAHGIETNRFQKMDDKTLIKKKFGVHTRYCVGIFGRVRAQKGIDLFVRSHIEFLQKNENVSALICGAILPAQESFVSDLQQQITDAGLGNRIVFLGEQPFDLIPSIMASMDLNCALSTNEGFGLIVLESLASSVPVIATNAGAWKDIIVESKNGYVINVGDESGLVTRLTECFENPHKLQEMGMHGREHVMAHYQVENEAKTLCEVYQSL